MLSSESFSQAFAITLFNFSQHDYDHYAQVRCKAQVFTEQSKLDHKVVKDLTSDTQSLGGVQF